MTGPQSTVVRATILLWLAVCCSSTSLANNQVPQRRGKVIVIRGAFTVFSLGLNELGDKLARHGLDVDVIADISADRATSQLVAEYRRKQNMGPIIFIGHSRGAELGPREARELQTHKIPVKLIVMIDAVHQTTIPANVERCVNLYHQRSIGFIHGVPARADSRRTQMMNVDIDRLATRDQGGSINHFNIDSSSWLHDLVINEVLKVCPVVESPTARPTARKSAPVAKRSTARTATRPVAPAAVPDPAPRTARRQSASGLQYPSGIRGDLWADPPPPQSSTPHRPAPLPPGPSRRGAN